MSRLFIVFCIALLSIPVIAQACSCMKTTEASSRQTIEDAFFIGKVRVNVTRRLKGKMWGLYKADLEIIKTYKGNLQGNISAVYQSDSAACGSPKKPGKEYEVIISEHEEYQLYINGWCGNPLPEHWDELRGDTKQKQTILKEGFFSKETFFPKKFFNKKSLIEWAHTSSWPGGKIEEITFVNHDIIVVFREHTSGVVSSDAAVYVLRENIWYLIKSYPQIWGNSIAVEKKAKKLIFSTTKNPAILFELTPEDFTGEQ